MITLSRAWHISIIHRMIRSDAIYHRIWTVILLSTNTINTPSTCSSTCSSSSVMLSDCQIPTVIGLEFNCNVVASVILGNSRRRSNFDCNQTEIRSDSGAHYGRQCVGASDRNSIRFQSQFYQNLIQVRSETHRRHSPIDSSITGL